MVRDKRSDGESALVPEGHLAYRRMPIEVESPEEFGYGNITCNLAESSITDGIWTAMDLDLGDLVLGYGDHLGNPSLREQIANGAPQLGPEDVLVTAGAAAALFIVNTSLMGRDDHVIVMHPNYATNVETPRAIGAEVEFLPLAFEDGWQLDVERLAGMIRPETRLISLTSPHNPTGAVLPEGSLRRVIELVEEAGCVLLFDETYRDMACGDLPPLAAALSTRAISVSSLSKSYGLPGLRIGWLINRDERLKEAFLAAKEQIFICGSVVDEEVAYRFLIHRADHLPRIKAHLRAGLEAVRAWMEGNAYLEWVEPAGGAVCFPRIKPGVDLDLDLFYRVLIEEYGTFVGPGHWFEMDRRFMRIGFGWPSLTELEQGLQSISRAIERALLA